MLVARNQRNVRAVHELGILPESTVYFDEQLAFSGDRSGRLAGRDAWLSRALTATAGCSVLLLDPDNGLASAVERSAKKAGKYAYAEEIREMVSRGQTIILYQHLDRSAPAVEQVKRRANRLMGELQLCQLPHALRYRRGTSRVYYFLTSPAHKPVVQDTITALTTGPWGQHFSLQE